jgi:succinate-semialdehyde dehydrogenase / glutarate-semialdehyde dehydrogenase
MAATYKMFIDGEWTDAKSGKTLGVINPANEEIIAEVPYGGREDTARAIAAAARVFPEWAAKTPYERAAVLKRTAELMRERLEALARTLTMEEGKVLLEARGEITGSAAYFEWFAEEAKRAYGQLIPQTLPNKRHMILKHPVGVVASIAPWNFPVLLQARKIAPALAAGCPVVARPASQTPLATMELFQCLADAGCPPGVANLVTGAPQELTDEFMENRAVRKISFTGSTEVGKELMRRAADQVKRISLELGGHAPVIVFPDVDVEAAAKVTTVGKFRNMGQVCISPTRIYVHDRIRKEFTDAAVEFSRGLRVGDGLDPNVDVGPLFEERNVKQTMAFIQDATSHGAKVLAGGRKPEGDQYRRGYYFEPTVLTDINPQMRLTCEETFGPIMPLMQFDTVEQALQAANNTNYGLAAYVLTNDLKTAICMAEGLEYGIIGINDTVPATAQAPFGGMKESGVGREGSHEGLEAYLETKYVSIGM